MQVAHKHMVIKKKKNFFFKKRKKMLLLTFQVSLSLFSRNIVCEMYDCHLCKSCIRKQVDDSNSLRGSTRVDNGITTMKQQQI
jgi:hypothetical protein